MAPRLHSHPSALDSGYCEPDPPATGAKVDATLVKDSSSRCITRCINVFVDCSPTLLLFQAGDIHPCHSRLYASYFWGARVPTPIAHLPWTRFPSLSFFKPFSCVICFPRAAPVSDASMLCATLLAHRHFLEPLGCLARHAVVFTVWLSSGCGRTLICPALCCYRYVWNERSGGC